MNTKILAAVMCLAVAIIAQGQDSLTNGLVAYFPFNANANDESGNANNGVVSAATLTVDRFGNPNSAYAFDGISSLITVPDSPSLRITNDITVTCWLNFSQTNFGGVGVRFVGKGGDGGRNYGLWLDQGAYWMFQQFPPQGGNGCQENTASANPVVVVLDKWYQLVGVRSGTISRLYVDGILAQVRSPTCSASTYSGNEPLIIGAPGYTGGPGNQPNMMHGILDDIRIYNRALSTNELTRLYAIESRLQQTSIAKAVRLDYTNLFLGAIYQPQVSTNLITWANLGLPFTATTSTNSHYVDVQNWNAFFRLTVP